jgi:hypothetical protein
VSVSRRLAAFALVLAVCFGGAYAVGAAVGPIDSAPIDGAPAGTSSHCGGHGG